MNKNIFLLAISFAIYFIQIGIIPLRIKKLKKKAGECVLEIQNKKSFSFDVAIFILSFVLIAISLVNDFSFYIYIVLCACALIGQEIAIRDFIMNRRSGIYKNGIISTGNYVSFNQIESFPVLELPENEQKNHDESTLDILTKKNGIITLIFNDKNECQNAVKKIFDLHPELKPK